MVARHLVFLVGQVLAAQAHLPVAAENSIVLAFPKVVPSAANPLGCWDWWGYTGPDHLWRDGRQMKVLDDWLVSLSGADPH